MIPIGFRMITPGQIKAARAMLNLSQRQLAKKALVSLATLNNIERGAQTDPKLSTIMAIERALSAKGIVFTNDFDGTGVLLRPVKSEGDAATILIIDDSREDRTLYKHWLEVARNKKYRVVEAENARAGYGAFVEYHPDCVLLDFKMYGMDGFQLLAEMKKDRMRLPPIVLVSAMYNAVLQETAEKQGIRTCLDKKNITKEVLHAAVEHAIA